jgi:RND family efflux transporter MFP subunit
MARSVIRKAGWVILALAALGSAGYAARNTLMALLPEPATEVPAVAERAAQPVRVTRVVFSSAGAAESYTGTIRPQHEAALGFRLPGKLLSRLVNVGDRVVAGQILARLDDTDARLELEAAEAERVAASTDLVRAEADLARSRDLFEAGHVAQAALDRAISVVAEAASRADRAKQMRQLAANRLSYMDLAAEADGIVTATLAETGQVMAAGQPVLSVARTDALDVVFALPEQHRNRLDAAVATALLWGTEEQTYALALRDISPDVDPLGRTYRVRMTLSAPDADAALGRTMTVRLAMTGALPVALLPMAAVVSDGNGASVWRLPPGMELVERVPVELIAVDGQVAMVRGGLAEGDIVVSLGAHKIDPARPVRVVETTVTPES